MADFSSTYTDQLPDRYVPGGTGPYRSVRRTLVVILSKVCHTGWYHPYRTVCIGPLADQYTDRPLLGSTTDWGCFRPVTTQNQSSAADFKP
ncbi:hypothetical protein B296_00058447 [Ensete ventricosum]|uniref:Uncharacterized protein n=1 Tax=Ensete ventricosum TaxID=4639 RepID=A0A426XM44_ENSVE|nr:hypothetical protein B296_00058447 [Ensete ventricosum]